MKNLALLFGTLIVTIAVVVGVAVLLVQKTKAPQQAQDPSFVLGDGRLQKGNPDAPITIVEFSDLQCPACRAVQPIVSAVLSQASSSARLVFRHFPLESIHKNALSAAIASEAAANQGKFWQYHDILYEKQEEWEKVEDPRELFRSYAKTLGLNEDRFVSDMAKNIGEQFVRKDQQDGTALGIPGTPTFYVNNVRVDIRDLQSTVTRLLAQ